MAPHLEPGETSVGISMNLSHTAATPLGMEVRAVTRGYPGGRPENHL